MTKTNNDLGDPGPYMVCEVCNRPLDRIGVLDTETDERIPGPYVHLADVDHEPVPVLGTPLTADLRCDFCHTPNPAFVFVPRRAIRITTHGAVQDYSSPWQCCAECRPLIRRDRMSRLIDRATAAYFALSATSTPLPRKMIRKHYRELYNKFFNSSPAGPYELRIPAAPKPFGKRGGRRGM